MNERDYIDYEDDDSSLKEEGISDSELMFVDDDDTGDDDASGDEEILVDPDPRYRRSWRDTEKFMEIRELYKIINDELYTGFTKEDYFEEYENR